MTINTTEIKNIAALSNTIITSGTDRFNYVIYLDTFDGQLLPIKHFWHKDYTVSLPENYIVLTTVNFPMTIEELKDDIQLRAYESNIKITFIEDKKIPLVVNLQSIINLSCEMVHHEPNTMYINYSESTHEVYLTETLLNHSDISAIYLFSTEKHMSVKQIKKHIEKVFGKEFIITYQY